MRANYEAHRSATARRSRANVTVQGWLRDGGNLWRTGDNVYVYSPMAMLNLVMKIQTATFTQDNKGGTTTMLELVLPWRLSATSDRFGHGTPSNSPADDAAVAATAATPTADRRHQTAYHHQR